MSVSTPYISEIRVFSYGFPPSGWALCNGQLLPINQNQALFSLLGTTYGGDGISTFALPNLQGSVPLHLGNGFTLGQRAGEAAVTLTTGQIPAHTHTPIASSSQASAADPSNAFWANSSHPAYAPSTSVELAPQAIGSTGSNQAHQNMSPYLVLSFCIALIGFFPSRN
jgi:microcystin-dependent protein